MKGDSVDMSLDRMSHSAEKKAAGRRPISKIVRKRYMRPAMLSLRSLTVHSVNFPKRNFAFIIKAVFDIVAIVYVLFSACKRRFTRLLVWIN